MTARNKNKLKWVQHYANQILRLYRRWQGPLGVATTYVEQIKKDLEGFYEDPLKRRLIENTY